MTRESWRVARLGVYHAADRCDECGLRGPEVVVSDELFFENGGTRNIQGLRRVTRYLTHAEALVCVDTHACGRRKRKFQDPLGAAA